MTHPVLDVAARIDHALKDVADVNPCFMSAADKAEALCRLSEVESRVAELRLRIMADAGDVAETTAARDVGEWLATHAHLGHHDARADLALATALDRRWGLLAAALREGAVSLTQARVIARALDQLVDLPDLPRDALQRAETALIEHAADFGPRQLARLGHRILDVVAPEIAEEAEARRLAELEAAAHRRTRLSLRPQGDGTTRISGLIPDASATRLATYLEAFTNPRKSETTDEPTTGALNRLGAYPRRLGRAFCDFLEACDPHRLPLHGGDATTVIVTISLDQLRDELATAGILGAGGVEDELRISAAEARRLACSATIIPTVLGGDSEPLDLGRARRLFSPAQRRALLLRDRICRAEGCDVPGRWCEAHHWQPWGSGGRTDLADGVLLCSHHHHVAHDPRCAGQRLANGDVRFSRRT